MFSFYVICDQAQKELLDAELDFHKKLSSGEDTTDLKRKLGQLQVEVIHTLVKRNICSVFCCIQSVLRSLDSSWQRSDEVVSVTRSAEQEHGFC